MFPFQEECFNPPFPLFVTRRVMTPSTLFTRHTFQIRLCQLPPSRPNCAFVCLKIHQMIGRLTLHRMTGPPILKPNLRNQKFHSSGVPHHNWIYHRVDQRNKTNKKNKNRVFEAVVVLGQKNKKYKLIFFNACLCRVVSSKWRKWTLTANILKILTNSRE